MSTSTTSPELVITRTFRAPRALVWKAWTDPVQTVKWMGPKNHPARHCENDLRVGGAWAFCLKVDDGSGDLWMRGIYRELVEPERLSFTFAWDGDDGKPENEMLITIRLSEEGPNTKMTFHQTLFNSPEQRDRHREGWSSCFDRLDELLA